MSRPQAGSVSEAGTGHGTVAGCQRQLVREGSKIGEGEERGLRWGRDGPAASIPLRDCGGLEAGGRRQWSPNPVLSCCFSGCSSGLCAAQGCPHWPSVAFALLPFIFIYLLTFMKFSFHPILIAHVVLTIPLQPSHPAVCAAVCLSVTREIKIVSSRTYV